MAKFDYQLSPAHHESFKHDGALFLESVIGGEFLDRLVTATERARDYDGGFWFKIYLWRFDPDFRDCCLASPLPGIAAQLLQTDKVNLLYDQLFVKPPKGEPTPWHNDLPYWPVDGTSVMSIWLALGDVTLGNGGLEFIRGSHRWGRRFETFDYEPDGTGYQAMPQKNPENEPTPDFDAERDQHEILTWDMKPGDAVAFHALTVHHANRNTTAGQPRKGYALRFMGREVRYREGPAMNEYVLNPDLSPGDVMDSEKYPVVYDATA